MFTHVSAISSRVSFWIILWRQYQWSLLQWQGQCQLLSYQMRPWSHSLLTRASCRAWQPWTHGHGTGIHWLGGGTPDQCSGAHDPSWQFLANHVRGPGCEALWHCGAWEPGLSRAAPSSAQNLLVQGYGSESNYMLGMRPDLSLVSPSHTPSILPFSHRNDFSFMLSWVGRRILSSRGSTE